MAQAYYAACREGDAFCCVRGQNSGIVELLLHLAGSETRSHTSPWSPSGCGKQVNILCQPSVDSSRARRVVCTSFEDRQVCTEDRGRVARGHTGKSALN